MLPRPVRGWEFPIKAVDSVESQSGDGRWGLLLPVHREENYSSTREEYLVLSKRPLEHFPPFCVWHYISIYKRNLQYPARYNMLSVLICHVMTRWEVKSLRAQLTMPVFSIQGFLDLQPLWVFLPTPQLTEAEENSLRVMHSPVDSSFPTCESGTPLLLWTLTLELTSESSSPSFKGSVFSYSTISITWFSSGASPEEKPNFLIAHDKLKTPVPPQQNLRGA